MKWFRKTFVWMVAVGLGASPVMGQSGGVTLGRPMPLPGSVQQASYTVRGANPGDEPKHLFLPPDVIPLPTTKIPAPFTPAQAVQPKELPNVIEIVVDPKVGAEKIAPPKKAQPLEESTERIIILEDGAGLTEWTGNRRFYARAEFLLWTARGFHLPALATTASAADNPDTRAALGFQSTRLIFGDTNVTGGLRPGARLTLGYEFDPTGICTLEGSAFFLSRKTDSTVFSSDQFPVLGRPFFNINDGVQARELTTTPEFATGTLQIHAASTLWGADVNNRVLLWNECDFSLSGSIGFRYLDLSDRLSIEEFTTFINDVPAAPGNPPVFAKGDRTFLFDRFDTRNRFYGGQLGIDAEWRRGPWYFDLGIKLGLGVTRSTVVVDGAQQFNRANGTVQTFQGGLYALSSNIGHHSRSRFAVVPEANLKVGYNVTDGVRVFVGYDFLFWNNVMRPGDQIDPGLDANRIPNIGKTFTPANQVRPALPFRTTSYWAQGLNAGVEIRY